MPINGLSVVVGFGRDTTNERKGGLRTRGLRLGPTALATLAALLAACVEEKGCGWTHAYAIAKQMHLGYRSTRLALSALHDLGFVERRKREVDGRLRVEYRLTPEGKRFAVESLRSYFAREPVVAREKPAAANDELSQAALVKVKRG